MGHVTDLWMFGAFETAAFPSQWTGHTFLSPVGRLWAKKTVFGAYIDDDATCFDVSISCGLPLYIHFSFKIKQSIGEMFGSHTSSCFQKRTP